MLIFISFILITFYFNLKLSYYLLFVNLFRIYHVNITKYLTNYIYLIYNTYAYLGRVLNISNVFIWNNFSNLNCLREKDNKLLDS